MAYCKYRIKGIAPHECGLLAVGTIDDKPMCKQHVAAVRRATTMRSNRRTKDTERDAKVAEWSGRVSRAAAMLGIEAHLDSLGPNYIKAVVVSLDDFERLAERLKPDTSAGRGDNNDP